MTIFLIVGKFSQSERSYQNSLPWLAEISKTKKQSQIDAKLYPFIPKIWLWIRLKNFSIFWIIIFFLKNEEKRANTIFHRWKIFYFNKLFVEQMKLPVIFTVYRTEKWLLNIIIFFGFFGGFWGNWDCLGFDWLSVHMSHSFIQKIRLKVFNLNEKINYIKRGGV